MKSFQKSVSVLVLPLLFVPIAEASASRLDRITGFAFGGALSGDGSVFQFTAHCGPAGDCALVPGLVDKSTNEYSFIDNDNRFDQSIISDISFDGSVVVGENLGRPSIWTSEGLQVLAEPQRRNPYENGVLATNADGSVVGGHLNGSPQLWIDGSPQTLPDALNGSGSITGISSDGQTFVGEIKHGTETVGFVSTLVSTTFLDTPEDFSWSNATGVSGDGRSVYGFHHRAGGGEQRGQAGFIWTEESGMINLGGMIPAAATFDGQTVVGYRAHNPLDNSSLDAKIWDAAHGVRNLRDVYAEQIVSFNPERGLYEATAISQDGRTIAGTTFEENAWILHVGDFANCDLNRDGTCDARDIDGFQSYLSRPKILQSLVRINTAYDLVPTDPTTPSSISFDGSDISIDDLHELLRLMHVAPGDTDLNGRVEMKDFLTLSANFGQNGGWAQGDSDASGHIDFADFLALSANFGESSVAASVPEPSSIPCLLFLAAFASKSWRSRIHRGEAAPVNSQLPLA